MRRVLLILATSVALGAVATAHAGTLTMATWTQDLGNAQVGVPITASGAARATGGFSGYGWEGCACLSLSVPAFQYTNFVPKTGNAVVDLAWILTLGGVQQKLTATQHGVHPVQPIPGTVLLKTAMHTNASMYVVGGITLLHIPLSVGAGKTEMGTIDVLGLPHSFTVHQSAWGGTGRRTFTGLTTKGQPLADVAVTNTFFVPHDGQPGQMTLVAPTLIEIHGALAQRRTVSFSRLHFSFAAGDFDPPCVVPEPHQLLLLALGFVGWLSALWRSAA